MKFAPIDPFTPSLIMESSTLTASPSSDSLPLIVNCSNGPGKFFSSHLANVSTWAHFDCWPSGRLENCITRPNLGRLRRCWQTSRYAHRHAANLVITHDPCIAATCEYFLRQLGYHGKHLAFSFNFAELPTGFKKRLIAHNLRQVDRFVVYSTVEKKFYHQAFGIPLEKIDFIHWGVGRPIVENPGHPVEPGPYVYALGGNARDYATLMAAMAELPAIRLVAVVRPHNLQGLKVPPNVTVYTNLSLGRSMNLLKFARFMVLPLTSSKVPCGHVTLVNAMHLSKAFLITRSTGVEDYVQDGVNALTCEAKSVPSMVAGIRRLYECPALCERLGANGAAFAAARCSESNTFDYIKRYLGENGIIS